ncbi:DUF6412 domain-containing protein [Mycetocola reblochoni]|uniref:Uncharacterized protein n=2 Tax=Mycetocola reblochoni TaxID=331618 RepID=A0A1R4IIN2_9MICO|nr:hypothetical protein [Mycetocola reblochoni]RLP69661.1 hypothetical protein D9V30_06930 [Mycetocola reblochoni]SJN19579.1 hypothetical protein FM119_01960 [Mycetocola reblochoni REB411]
MIAVLALARLLAGIVQAPQTAELWAVIAALGAIGIAGGLLLGRAVSNGIRLPSGVDAPPRRCDPVRSSAPLRPQIAPDAAGRPRPRAPGTPTTPAIA